MLRLFLAIPLAAEVRHYLSEVENQLSTSMSGSAVNWVKPENFHITLYFLGEVPEALIDPLQRALQTVEYPESFVCHLTGIGAFPNLKNPQVIFVGVTPHPQLTMLQDRLATTLSDLGLRVEKRRFHPHITMGRVRRGSDEIVPDRHRILPHVISVDQFVLMESTLTPHGSAYTARCAYEF